MASVFGLRCSRHCVASTWPTSVVPMPKARAPKAPCVLVWLSPQTMVLPGWVSPSSGPMTCTMPRCVAAQAQQLDAERGAVGLELARPACAAESTAIGAPPNTCSVRVGVEWSMVASVRSGRRTGRPRSRSTANACGEVTSCIRCRSMYSTAGVSARLGDDLVTLPDLLEQRLRCSACATLSRQAATRGARPCRRSRASPTCRWVLPENRPKNACLQRLGDRAALAAADRRCGPPSGSG